MSKKKTYRKYENWVKAAIAATGKIDMFPHLNIPEMKARHWIKHGFIVDDPALEAVTAAICESHDRQEQMKRELNEIKASSKLLKDVAEILGYKLRWNHIDDTQVRDKILDAISTAMTAARREVCLQFLDLSLSRYKRWRREKRGCGLPQTKLCPKGSRQNQLTFQEIQNMGELVTSKEYSHFPIRSLHYYAKRNGLLYCTYSTWRKYINLYNWLRPRKKRIKKTERIGIRAKRPNEIWHMDVSYFILPNGNKCFIQAIIDNYSRYVLAWHVSESFDGAKTASLLECALQCASGPKRKKGNLSVIVDGGGENKSHEVKKLESLGHFKKKVARFEISFSNSIVEALFRSLKHNYLFHKTIASPKSLRYHVNFWVKQHNDVIPHTAFMGETPLERFSKTWDKEEEIRILVKHEDAVKLRIKHNQKVFCQLCAVA